MADINGFLPACEGCGWQGLAMPTRRLALEAAHDHEYNKGCPARGELSPSILQLKEADAVKQRVQWQRRKARREAAARRGMVSQPRQPS